MPQLKKTNTALNYVFIIAGAMLVGIAYNVFLLPAQLAAGGVSGISTILFELYGTKPALVQAIINLPLFVVGFIALGKDFSYKTLLGTMMVPLTIYLTEALVAKGSHDLLSSIYGGIVLGVGLGLVYRGGGSTGGTAALAQILKKYASISSGFSQLIVDGFVVVASAFVFSFELALYALISIFVTSKVIDFVQLQSGDNKLVLIITDNEERVTSLIYEHVERGVTQVQSFGAFSKKERALLLCVMEQAEAIYFKQIITNEEPNSFVIFLSASEILGRGFSKAKI
ncbi:membrane protein [Lysinibacillus sp. BF-4]|uniref:YitT family protein n=1 Tax=Lysinibacillus sp. BF-4 TaxID=1473546 RepID=UPI00050635FC|nr:YitT family protein [Lysinibacillus sp. BF-4]KFL43174.1 membrane protein [Lysinibacillus sp. BF-4]